MEQRDRVVFLLGAGASRDAGVPLMAEFRDAAASIGQSSWLDSLLERIGIGADEKNMEVIWSRLDMAAAVGVPCLRGDHDEFVRLAAETLHYDPCAVESCAYAALVRGLLGCNGVAKEHLSHDRLSFVAFNQDVALDKVLHKVGCKCFGKGKWAGWLRYGIGRPGEECPRYPPKLLKLHGSLNWGMCEDDACGSGIRMFPEFSEVPAVLHRTACEYHGQDKTRKHRPLMVPPSWLRAPYGHELRRIWAQAHEELRRARLVVIVGHSWPDSDVYYEHLLALAFRESVPCRFLVVDPCKCTAQKYACRLKRLAPKAQVCEVHTEFAAAVDCIVEEVGKALASP